MGGICNRCHGPVSPAYTEYCHQYFLFQKAAVIHGVARGMQGPDDRAGSSDGAGDGFGEQSTVADSAEPRTSGLPRRLLDGVCQPGSNDGGAGALWYPMVERGGKPG